MYDNASIRLTAPVSLRHVAIFFEASRLFMMILTKKRQELQQQSYRQDLVPSTSGNSGA